MLCLCLDDSHHMQPNKKSIIGSSIVSNRGICRPFSNRYIPPLSWASAFGKAQVFGICFPAHLPELLVDQEPRLSFRALTLAGRLADTLAAAVFGNRFCLGRFCLCLLCQAGFFLLLSCLVCCPRLLCGNGRHKLMMLIIPVTISLHKPFTEAVCHWQKCHTVCLRRIIFMDCLIAHLSERVQNLCQILCQQAFTIKRIDPLDCGIFLREWDSIVGKHQVDDGFPNHPQLHQARVWITVGVFLCQLSKICEDWKIF